MQELVKKQKEGSLDHEEEKKLDRRLGNFYKFDAFGETYKVNHCHVARCIISAVLILIVVNIVYMTESAI